MRSTVLMVAGVLILVGSAIGSLVNLALLVADHTGRADHAVGLVTSVAGLLFGLAVLSARPLAALAAALYALVVSIVAALAGRWSGVAIGLVLLLLLVWHVSDLMSDAAPAPPHPSPPNQG